MTKDDEYVMPEGHDRDADGLAEELLVDAMLRGYYQDTPEANVQRVTRAYQALQARSLSENPIWLRAACFATGRRPAPSTIYSDIACFAVLASHTTAAALIHQYVKQFKKTARSRADDGILRQTPGPRVIPWHWKAGLSSAAAAIIVLGLMLVLSAPQQVQANLAPVLAAFDIGDQTYQIDVGRDSEQPDPRLEFGRRRRGHRPPFRPPGRSMKARLLDGASLYTRGRNYVLTCRGPRGGKIVKGFDGQESWLVTPWGRSKRGQDHSLLQEDLPEHISSLLFLDLRTTLHKIQEKYTLSGPARGTAEDAPLQLDYYIARRIDPQGRIPKRIELWVDTQSNQLYQILFSGVRFHSRYKSPYTLEIRLVNTDPLPTDWFRQQAHARTAAALPMK